MLGPFGGPLACSLHLKSIGQVDEWFGWELGMQGPEMETSVSGIERQSESAGDDPRSPVLFDTGEIYAIPHRTYSSIVKPTLDRILAIAALIILSPLLVLLAGLIWVAMGSPVILKQERAGRYGVPFGLYKFRTMEPDRRQRGVEFVGDDRRRTHKSVNDPRITPLGRWLRASRLDELPQFINVVKGELSLVGPRPELVSVVATYEPWQHRRHAVKPGLTGVWQISDAGDKLLVECTELELTYLESISLGTDLSIMLRTLPAMVRRAGI